MENEAQIKQYIEEKQSNNSLSEIKKEFNSLAWEIWLWKEKKEQDDWPKLFEWLKNDEKLLKYAELKMKEDDLKLWEKFKMELLELRLSITCSYFKDFQTFLEKLKHRDDVGRNTETNTMIMPDYSEWSDSPYVNVSPEIDDSDVMEVAHLWSPNRENRSRWEKLEVNREQRIKFLFPEWLPKNQKEMESKYLTSITVSILDEQWNITEKTLQVHKKLAKTYEAIFKELVSYWIKVDGNSTWAYCRRKIRRWNKQSEHSFWSAIDINRAVNGWVYGTTDKNSIYYNNQTTVEIFKKYWFAWWWDRSKQSDDPMHFTYLWW